MENPILNNPYDEPTKHYDHDENGQILYSSIIDGRRDYNPSLNIAPTSGNQQGLLPGMSNDYSQHLINRVRIQVKSWREENYLNTTKVTKDLLEYWFLNDERINNHKLFFVQREAIETAIYLNEVADSSYDSNIGSRFKTEITEATIVDTVDNSLPRVCFKMATGTGKTVVMADLLLYHYQG